MEQQPNREQSFSQQPLSGYPSYPQQPPIPPPPPRKKSRKPLIFGCLGAIALFCLIIVIIAIATSGSPSQATAPTATPVTQAHATKGAATVAPTKTPKAASVPSGLPVTHGTPRLGGPLSDFIGAYGQPNGNSNPPSYEFQEVNNINEVGAMGIGSSCSSPLCVSEQHIDDITVQSPDQTNGFTASEAEAKCMAFAPTDAHYKQKIPFADGTGYDTVYSSASLAKMFAASEFTDGSGNTVTPGMFDVSYLYADNKVGIGSCDMITGEQQTNG